LLVSIIIPVYNAEKYLRKCVDSVLEQTYSNIEVILVDDGSRDSSAQICDEYAQKDRRIKVIHKENGGVSIARNTGIDVSKGELVAFVDADDYLSGVMIEKLYNALGSNDFSICRFVREYEDKSIPHQEDNLELLAAKPYELKYIMVDKYNRDYEDKTVSDKVFGSVWRTLFRKDIIQNNLIRFCEGMKIAEDRLFLLEYCSNCTSGGFVDEYLYHYRVGLSTSATAVFNKYQKNLHKSQKKLIEKQIDLINKSAMLDCAEKQKLIAYLKFKVCYTVTLNEILYNSVNPTEVLKTVFSDKFYSKALKFKHFKYMYQFYNISVKTLVLYMMIKFRMWGTIQRILCKR